MQVLMKAFLVIEWLQAIALLFQLKTVQLMYKVLYQALTKAKDKAHMLNMILMTLI